MDSLAFWYQSLNAFLKMLLLNAGDWTWWREVMAAKETRGLALMVSWFPFSLNPDSMDSPAEGLGMKGNTAQTPMSPEMSINWCYCSPQLWEKNSKEQCPTVTAVTGVWGAEGTKPKWSLDSAPHLPCEDRHFPTVPCEDSRASDTSEAAALSPWISPTSPASLLCWSLSMWTHQCTFC